MTGTLVLREESMAVLRQDAGRRFLRRMVGELRRQFPDEAEGLRPAGVLAGLAQARSYGLSGSRDLFRYFCLLLLAGWDGQSEPQQPWLDGILRDSRMSTPAQRLEYAWKHLERQLRVAQENAAARRRFALGTASVR
ncbi:MAG: hypothetical protein JNK87_28790 [Bryobacterales bacterium]|nr:hypothetical protein [Bryobacterales bacterium]